MHFHVRGPSPYIFDSIRTTNLTTLPPDSNTHFGSRSQSGKVFSINLKRPSRASPEVLVATAVDDPGLHRGVRNIAEGSAGVGVALRNLYDSGCWLLHFVASCSEVIIVSTERATGAKPLFAPRLLGDHAAPSLGASSRLMCKCPLSDKTTSRDLGAQTIRLQGRLFAGQDDCSLRIACTTVSG
jgi:hypothetical protein